jgi:hypothetical protein
MSETNPDDRWLRDPLPVPDEAVVWEEDVAAMTEDEFYRYLEEGDGGLAFGA